MAFQIVVSVDDNLSVAAVINAPPGAQVPVALMLGVMEQAKLLLSEPLFKALTSEKPKVVAAPASAMRALPKDPRDN